MYERLALERELADLGRQFQVPSLAPPPDFVLDGFAFDKATLTAAHDRTLDAVAQVVSNNRVMTPVSLISAIGHTDAFGKERYNAELGMRRAEAVKTRLLQKLDALHPSLKTDLVIMPSTRGEHEPVTRRKTAAARAKNRRVELFITKSAPKPLPKPAPAPTPKVWAPPTSVDEALELFQEARRLDQTKPPNIKQAALYAKWVSEFIEPIARKDRFEARFPLGRGVLSRFRDVYERRGAWEFVSHAQSYTRSIKMKLAMGASIGGWWEATTTTLEASRYFLEVCNDEGVSDEIKDAPRYRADMRRAQDASLTNGEVRMLRWMQKRKMLFAKFEKTWGVDRRAIAGAVVWEALENRQFITFSSVGPGKVHVPASLLGIVPLQRNTVAEQVEVAGYLPKVSDWARSSKLSRIQGAGEYIGAIMKAGADVAWKELQVDLYGDAPMLTWIFNSVDLPGWKARIAAKKARGDRTFTATGPMSEWVARKLDYLTRGVGKPKAVFKPTP